MWLDAALQSLHEPLEGSANSELCRGDGLGFHKPTLRFSTIDISRHAHTACISIHDLSRGGHRGEEESEREREDNTAQEYSGALSLAGSFNFPSVLSLFSHGCYLLAEVSGFFCEDKTRERLLIVLNTEKGVGARRLKSRETDGQEETNKKKDKYK